MPDPKKLNRALNNLRNPPVQAVPEPTQAEIIDAAIRRLMPEIVSATARAVVESISFPDAPADRTDDLLSAISENTVSVDLSPVLERMNRIQADVDELKSPKKFQMEHQRNGRGQLDRTIITEVCD